MTVPPPSPVSDSDIEQIARGLDRARIDASPIDFVTSTLPDLDWDSARQIARRCDALRTDAGQTQIGWKLGWTSAAMRTALGIDRPNWGTLWDTQRGGSTLSLANYIHPKVEPELVWRTPATLSADMTAGDIARLGGEWALGIEVVDPRFPSFGFKALDNTADNSSSAAIRLGEFFENVTDLEDLEVAFSNGVEARSGLGSQTMGSPWEAISWLVRSLAKEQLHVNSGDIIFTGGLTAPFDAVVESTYDLSCSRLGCTTVSFTR